MTHMKDLIEVGTIVRYRTYGGGTRDIRVTAVDTYDGDRTEFDGIVVSGDERGTGVWARFGQVIRVTRTDRVYANPVGLDMAYVSKVRA